jgi:hypothetical protein
MSDQLQKTVIGRLWTRWTWWAGALGPLAWPRRGCGPKACGRPVPSSILSIVPSVANGTNTHPRKRIPKHTHTPNVLWACSPQRNTTPQTNPQAHTYAERAVGLQPAAEHDPANETPSTHIRRTCCGLAARSGTRPRKRNPKHAHTPNVLWACSPQRNMTPQTNPQARTYAERAVGLQPAAAHDPANENPKQPFPCRAAGFCRVIIRLNIYFYLHITNADDFI